MQPHWNLLIELVRMMAHELKSFDHDGMELRFMSSQKGWTSTKSTTLTKELQNHIRKGKSDINKVLGILLYDYTTKLRVHTQKLRQYQSTSGVKSIMRRKPPRVKPLYIYILTDGKWEDGDDATKMIRETAMHLKKDNHSRRQLGIEIIRFGNDPDSKARLKALDDLDQNQEDPLL
jgi:hypothetical protein